MQTLLDCEDEVVAIVLHHGGDGLAGEDIVAEIDRPQRSEPSVMIVEQALAGVSHAILFFGVVLRCDEFRHQGDGCGLAGRDDHRRQHRVIRLNLAVGALAHQAMRAGELLRAKELCSIPGNERSAT